MLKNIRKKIWKDDFFWHIGGVVEKEKKPQGAALRPVVVEYSWTGLQNFVLFFNRRQQKSRKEVKR